MSDHDTCRVISMADYLARKDRSGRIERRSARCTSPGAKEIDSGSDRSPSRSSSIIPFPVPRHPLPAA